MQCFRTRKQTNQDEDSGRSGGFWLPMKPSRADFLAHAGQIILSNYTMGIMMAKATAS